MQLVTVMWCACYNIFEEFLFICFSTELSRFSSCFPRSCSKLKSSGIKVRFCFSTARPYNFSGFLAHVRVSTVLSLSLSFFLSKMLKLTEDYFVQISTLYTVFFQISEAMTRCKENSTLHNSGATAEMVPFILWEKTWATCGKRTNRMTDLAWQYDQNLTSILV